MSGPTIITTYESGEAVHLVVRLTDEDKDDIARRVIALLRPELVAEDVGTLDVSSPNVTGCTGCNTWLPSDEFEHKSGCPWLARYGTSREKTRYG